MQSWSNDDPKKQIEKLLRVLSEPTTPFTTKEVFSRLMTFNLDVVLASLEHEMSSEPDVVRLVLGVLMEISEHFGSESIQGLLPRISECIGHENRLVRMAAIQLVREARLAHPAVLRSLQSHIMDDEPIIQREAAVTLIELDDSLIKRLPIMFS